MLDKNKKSIIILVADDDADDRLLVKDALEEARLANPLYFVEDGEELIDYLKRRNNYKDMEELPLPGLILLDLNMPRKNGIEALKEIKSDEFLRSIPIVILTSSRAEEDILKTYNWGVNSFISKPVSFQTLVDMMKTLTKYWLEVVELPNSL